MNFRHFFEHFRTELIFGLLGHKTSLLGKAIFLKDTDSSFLLGTSSLLGISSLLGTSLLAHGCQGPGTRDQGPGTRDQGPGTLEIIEITFEIINTY